MGNDSGKYDGKGDGDSDETYQERLTRNLDELLQELRVTQTGVQILTAFLLTVPFTQRFSSMENLDKHVYLAVLSGAVAATGLVVAPVAFHRFLFRHGEREWLVTAANRSAIGGLVLLSLTMTGAVWLVFDVVGPRGLAWVAGAVAATFFAILWLLIPLRRRTVVRRLEALKDSG